MLFQLINDLIVKKRQSFSYQRGKMWKLINKILQSLQEGQTGQYGELHTHTVLKNAASGSIYSIHLIRPKKSRPCILLIGLIYIILSFQLNVGVLTGWRHILVSDLLNINKHFNVMWVVCRHDFVCVWESVYLFKKSCCLSFSTHHQPWCQILWCRISALLCQITSFSITNESLILSL